MSRLQRLSQHAKTGDLSATQVAQILGVEKSLVYDLVHEKQIECLAMRGNGRRRAAHRLCERKRETYHFEPRQVLSYIIQHTTGDRKTLFAEIELLLPQWLSFARLIARQCDEARKAAQPEPTPSTPAWLQPSSTRTRSPALRADPFAGCPEMFPVESLSRPASNPEPALPQ